MVGVGVALDGVGDPVVVAVGVLVVGDPVVVGVGSALHDVGDPVAVAVPGRSRMDGSHAEGATEYQ